MPGDLHVKATLQVSVRRFKIHPAVNKNLQQHPLTIACLTVGQWPLRFPSVKKNVSPKLSRIGARASCAGFWD